MKIHKFLIMLFTLALVTFSSQSWAYNADITHKQLSEKSAEFTVLDKNRGDYLAKLGFQDGLNEVFSTYGISKTVKEWIGEGGVQEDADSRFCHHFHDPLKPWDSAQLNFPCTSISRILFYNPVAPGNQSSLIWGVNHSKNLWNWEKAKVYYRLALTSPTAQERSHFWVSTFRSLGQVIHLLQDAGQPDHVRDDAHPFDDTGIMPAIEHLTAQRMNPANAVDQEIQTLLNNPVFPPNSLTQTSPVPGFAPVSHFFDKDIYDGTNPPADLSVGLAEYTNANFFSGDTVGKGNYPFPDLKDSRHTIVEQPFYNPDPRVQTIYPRKYYKKSCCGETASAKGGYLLAAVDLYDALRQLYPNMAQYQPIHPTIVDYNVLKDYTSLLLPRAIGYSAKAIDHFFRGDIKGDLKALANSEMELTITNLSNESLQNGRFHLYYDDIQNNRKELTLDFPDVTYMATGDTQVVKFFKPTDFDSSRVGKYVLVYQGEVGSEVGVVLGREVVEVGRILQLTSNDANDSLSYFVGAQIYWVTRKSDGEKEYYYYENGNIQSVFSSYYYVRDSFNEGKMSWIELKNGIYENYYFDGNKVIKLSSWGRIVGQDPYGSFPLNSGVLWDEVQKDNNGWTVRKHYFYDGFRTADLGAFVKRAFGYGDIFWVKYSQSRNLYQFIVNGNLFNENGQIPWYPKVFGKNMFAWNEYKADGFGGFVTEGHIFDNGLKTTIQGKAGTSQGWSSMVNFEKIGSQICWEETLTNSPERNIFCSSNGSVKKITNDNYQNHKLHDRTYYFNEFDIKVKILAWIKRYGDATYTLHVYKGGQTKDLFSMPIPFSYEVLVDGSHITWSASDGNDKEIFLYDHDKGLSVQISDNKFNDDQVQINNGKVVWSSFDGNDYEIYSFDSDTGTTIQVTDNNYDDRKPLINSFGEIVWEGNDGSDNEIFLYLPPK